MKNTYLFILDSEPTLDLSKYHEFTDIHIWNYANIINYSSEQNIYIYAKNLNELESADIGGVGSSGVGSGGMITKVEAARIVTGAGIEMLLTNLDNLEDAISGKDVGTRFTVVDDQIGRAHV